MMQKERALELVYFQVELTHTSRRIHTHPHVCVLIHPLTLIGKVVTQEDEDNNHSVQFTYSAMQREQPKEKQIPNCSTTS